MSELKSVSHSRYRQSRYTGQALSIGYCSAYVDQENQDVQCDFSLPFILFCSHAKNGVQISKIAPPPITFVPGRI